MDSNNEIINEEIEALEAIMMDEVIVHHNKSGYPKAVEITVKPATAQNIEEQHVRVTLIVTLPLGYPDQCPTIHLRNPRGIDDDVLELIKSESFKKCEEYLGFPVIYELIELVREKLTANNTPSCPCAICLFHFTDTDHFTKTQCFHYFHSNCLGRYILNCRETAAAEEKENQQPVWMMREKRQLLCPVCREPLNQEISGASLLENPPPEEGELMKDFDPASPEIRALQDKMMSLYQHQKSKGGIIDLEEEKNKFLISATVNNLESLEIENPLVGEVEETISQNREIPAKQKNIKASSQGNSKKGNHSQVNRREYCSNNWWSGGGRNRNNKKGNRAAIGGGRANYHAPTTAPPSKFADSAQQVFDDATKRSCQGRPTTQKTVEPNKYHDCKNASSANARLDESKKKSERTRFHRNSHHRGGGGGLSKGIPPPGISELERDGRSQATS